MTVETISPISYAVVVIGVVLIVVSGVLFSRRKDAWEQQGLTSMVGYNSFYFFGIKFDCIGKESRHGEIKSRHILFVTITYVESST